VDHPGVTEPAAAGGQASAPTLSMPAVGEACAKCAAPLVADQRYCLHCGEPRPHVGGPLSAEPANSSPRQSPPMTPPAPPGLPGAPGVASASRNNSVALIAGVGVLLLAMGVGVLIGRAGSGSAKAPPAQVISLGAAAGPAGAAATPTAATPETPAPTSKKEAKAKESSVKSSISKPAPPSTAANLRTGGSGQSYEQRSKKLPDVVSTG
jgi:hypothetical protein